MRHDCTPARLLLLICFKDLMGDDRKDAIVRMVIAVASGRRPAILPGRGQWENGIVLGVGGGVGAGGYMIPVARSWAEERVKSCFLAALALSAAQ